MTDKTADQDQGRTLTDADVKAIAEAAASAIENSIERRFYQNLGRGLWALAWKGIVVAIIAITVYGAVGGGGKH